MLYEPEKPKQLVKDWRHYLRFARNWFLGLGALTAFCLGYYHMCVDVWRDQDLEKVQIKAEELRVLKRDQAFVKAQVDRIVKAITNTPPHVEHHRHVTIEFHLYAPTNTNPNL